MKLEAIAVGGFVASLCAQGAFAAPPPNDQIQQATVVPAVPFSAAADFGQATTSASDPVDCVDLQYQNNTLWYAYTPAASGEVDAHISAAPNDSVTGFLGVFTGAPGALQPVKCSDAYTEPSNTTRFAVTAGTTYYVEAGSWFDEEGSAPGSFSLVASPPAVAGSVSVSPEATSYKQLKYDIETLFYVVYHVVIEVQLSCAPAVDSIEINATVVQGDSSVSDSGLVSCAGGSGSARLDLAPTGPYGNEPFYTGAATVTLTAFNFEANYKQTLTDAPIHITVERKGPR